MATPSPPDFLPLPGGESPDPALAIQRQPHQRQHQHRTISTAAFRWSILLNAVLSVLQLLIGMASGSLALIADAVHNTGDVAGLLVGWGAERLSARPVTRRFTYGFGRSTELASLINGVLILMAAAVVIVEGIQRLAHPVPVVTGPVALAAAAGIVVNLGSARLFAGHRHDLNRRAARLHLLSDAVLSAAVLVSAGLVSLTGWPILDTITALAVGLVVAWSGWRVLREAVMVSLDAVPAHIDLAVVEDALRQLPGVLDVHHIHVWAMSTSQTALTAHLVRRVGDHDDMQLLHGAKQRLAGLGIAHTTIQLEPPPP